MRRPLLVANWKMNKNHRQARSFAESLLAILAPETAGSAELVIAPPFTCLETLGTSLGDSRVDLAGQDVCAEEEGALTGEVSPGMLADLGCRYCIVGHSERRALFGETGEHVAAKATALLRAGLSPIVCVGETQGEREAGKTEEIVARQLETSLPRLKTPTAADLVVAYEPIWAIGTGVTATPEQAQEVHELLRDRLRQMLGEGAEEVRLQYGGSVGPANIQALMAQPDIDGALIGGASLDPESFASIVAKTELENTTP